MITIALLADHSETIPTLAQGFRAQANRDRALVRDWVKVARDVSLPPATPA